MVFESCEDVESAGRTWKSAGRGDGGSASLCRNGWSHLSRSNPPCSAFATNHFFGDMV